MASLAMPSKKEVHRAPLIAVEFRHCGPPAANTLLCVDHRAASSTSGVGGSILGGAAPMGNQGNIAGVSDNRASIHEPMNKFTLPVNAPTAALKQSPVFPALPRDGKSRMRWLFIVR